MPLNSCLQTGSGWLLCHALHAQIVTGLASAWPHKYRRGLAWVTPNPLQLFQHTPTRPQWALSLSYHVTITYILHICHVLCDHWLLRSKQATIKKDYHPYFARPRWYKSCAHKAINYYLLRYRSNFAFNISSSIFEPTSLLKMPSQTESYSHSRTNQISLFWTETFGHYQICPRVLR